MIPTRKTFRKQSNLTFLAPPPFCSLSLCLPLSLQWQPSVNLAARLMASKENPGILVDDSVRKCASRSYTFNAFDPIIAKGYKDPVPIFEPLTVLERSWGAIDQSFVGRHDEILRMVDVAKEMVSAAGQAAPRLILLSSPSGMGKSTTLVHGIENIRKMMSYSDSLLVTKNIGNEIGAHVPFKTIRPILLKALQHAMTGNDEDTVNSGKSLASLLNMSYRTITTACTEGSISNFSLSKAGDCLSLVGERLGAKASIIEAVRSLVLEDGGSGKLPQALDNSSSGLGDLVKFLSRILQLCAENNKLTLIALDDMVSVKG